MCIWAYTSWHVVDRLKYAFKFLKVIVAWTQHLPHLAHHERFLTRSVNFQNRDNSRPSIWLCQFHNFRSFHSEAGSFLPKVHKGVGASKSTHQIEPCLSPTSAVLATRLSRPTRVWDRTAETRGIAPIRLSARSASSRFRRSRPWIRFVCYSTSVVRATEQIPWWHMNSSRHL